MAQTNEIRSLSDSMKRLSEKTEQLLDKYDNGEKINTTEEKNISKRFDTISRKASLMLQWRKESGNEQFDWFFEGN